MSEGLLLIFVKNILLGKVKTRLAVTIGNQGAYDVYKHIVALMEAETSKIDTERHIYFSDTIIEGKWLGDKKFVQSEGDIGVRMKNAFENAFEAGYKRVVLIGSDIPDITEEIINDAFCKLSENTSVIGPSEDGGYYLVGLTEMNESIFEGIDWSTEKVLNQTLSKLSDYALVKELNDIDTVDDLKKSTIASDFQGLV